MFKFRLVVQDLHPGRISNCYESIVGLVKASNFHSLRVAVAYATLSGCKKLVHALRDYLGNNWTEMKKEWMVSIDFGTTEPDAIEFLKELPESSVRIPNGAEVLQRKLLPKVCFHPKIYMFGPLGDWANGPVALFSGSANLTASGLFAGTEQGIMLTWVSPLKDVERENELKKLSPTLDWWEDNWKTSTPLTDKVLADYRKLKAIHSHEDSSDVLKEYAGKTEIETAKGLTWAQARCLWVQTYGLYKNRGKSKPGNQLDLARGTRVYFGCSPATVSPDTYLGTVILQYGHMPSRECNIRFGNNFMDKVNLPVPGEDGPDTYDNSFIHFERIKPGHFRIKLSSGSSEVKTWRERSKKAGLLETMKGGRGFGFYS